MSLKEGRVTIPTNLDVAPETIELMKRWGADAIRDCDGTQFPEDLEDQGHIADLGDVLNAAGAVHQQGGGNNGDGGVLCAADGHFAKQRMAAMGHVFVQGSSLFSDGQ